jgi:hypothetical protein
MPTPKKGESKKEFIERCTPELINEGNSIGQALAICFDSYEKAKAEESMTLSLEVCTEYCIEFEAYFDGSNFYEVTREEDGVDHPCPDVNPVDLVKMLNLDPTKKYKFEVCAEEC